MQQIDWHIYRIVAKSSLNIPDSYALGTIDTVAVSGQPNRNDSHYEYKEDDILIVGGKFVFKNVRMNKFSLMKTGIGKKPVLSIGNRSGYYITASYVTMVINMKAWPS